MPTRQCPSCGKINLADDIYCECGYRLQKKYLIQADEEETLLGNCIEWLKDLVVFALNTGLRQNEQLSLTWPRVSLLRKTILIQETKSGKPRSIPLNQTAISILEQKAKTRCIKNDFVFISSHGAKINKQTLISAFNKALRESGISDFSCMD